MALVKCTDCKTQISDRSKKCPHCGAPTPFRFSGFTKFFLWLFVIFIGIPVVFIVGGKLSSPYEPAGSSAPQSDHADIYAAWGLAKREVANNLKSPSTAEFPDQVASSAITTDSEGRYVAKGWVDAQNGFGAIIRSDFTVKMRYAGNGKWLVVEGPIIIAR